MINNREKAPENRFADREYLHAKIYALRSGLLDRNDYEKIASAKGLRDAFPALAIDKISESPLKIKEAIFNVETEVIRYFLKTSQYYHFLFTGFLRYFETQNLKQHQAMEAQGQRLTVRP